MKKRRGSKKAPRPKPQDIKVEELHDILERAKAVPLSEEDHQKLRSAVDTLAFVTNELEGKGASIRRLRALFFGAKTEKTRRVVGDKAGKTDQDAASDGEDAAGAQPGEKKKRKGHGRNGASSYGGADKSTSKLDDVKRGQRCPDCDRGRLHHMPPSVLVRVKGVAPLAATVYEMERLRCSGCGEVFKAPPPEGIGERKYDETAAAMIALLKYGCGLPFNRIEGLERDLGIPLPASTQWDVVFEAAGRMRAPYEELIRQAAQGEVLHNDDTTMKILDIERAPPSIDPDASKERRGIFTSGIVSTSGAERRIALFFTGRQHAGENLADVLAKRAAELGAPIQMCDALAQNTAGDLDTIVANCIAHARRKFVEVADSFPDECEHVLLELAKVYCTDDVAKKQDLSAQERLLLHQAESGLVMGELKKWLQAQLDDRKVEPNSTLGDAIGYMLNHWKKLTLFLSQPGAPLDNNIVERALKKAILHRKNALFYKTENGARVGDLYMSLIHTAELCSAEVFDYLVTLQRHQDRIEREPERWMPWNYRAALARLGPDNAPRS